jgi:hypothetical protein
MLDYIAQNAMAIGFVAYLVITLGAVTVMHIVD